MKWKKEIRYIYTMEHYSTLKKKKKILLFATTWANWKDIMVNEISWAQQNQYCIIALTYKSKKINL